MRYRIGLTCLTSAAILSACSDATSPRSSAALTPDIGPILTIAGPSALGDEARFRFGEAVDGSPLAIATTQSGVIPAGRDCVLGPRDFVQTCTLPLNTLAFSYSIGGMDTIGLRMELSLSGTIPKTGSRPARLVSRRSTSWNFFAPAAPSRARYRAIEIGMSVQVNDSGRTTADTGITDLVRAGSPNPELFEAFPVPRLLGTSRRVVWTRIPGREPTFWRETTIYDSTKLIKSIIETPTVTKRCTIDLTITNKRPLVCD